MQLSAIDLNQILMLNALHIVYLVSNGLNVNNVIRTELDFLECHRFTVVQVHTRVYLSELSFT